MSIDGGRLYKAAIIGAGPIGIEIASVFKRNGLDYIHFDKGPVGATLTRWPRHTQFFSSAEWIAIAGIPIQNVDQGGINAETYLAYLRQIIEIFDLRINTYEEVLQISGSKGEFRLNTLCNGTEYSYRAEHIILASGDMSFPRLLDVPGEDLPHVTHYWQDPHFYFRKKLLIVGSRNSAVEAAIRCWRAGVDVTLSCRGKALENNRLISRLHLEADLLIKRGKIRFLPETVVKEIRPGLVTLRSHGGEEAKQPADFVYLAIGFRMDFKLYSMLGVGLRGEDEVPEFNPASMETAVPGVFVAGTATAGNQYKGYKVFITTCHDHGLKILKAIEPGSDIAALTGQVGNLAGRDYALSSEDIE